MVSSNLRLLWLIAIARLRALSWPAWVVLGLWLTWAVLQEPELLRAHDTHLVTGAAWWGVAMLLFALLLSETASAVRPTITWIANVSSSVAAGGLLALLLWIADLATKAMHSSQPLWTGVKFALAVSGLSGALAAARLLPQVTYRHLFIAIHVVAFGVLSVRLSAAQTLDWQTSAAAVLVAAAPVALLLDGRLAAAAGARRACTANHLK